MPEWADYIQAVGTSLAVVELDDEKVSDGGIVMPAGGDSNDRAFRRGLVISAGAGAVALNGEVVPNDCQEGEVIRFFRVDQIQVDWYGNNKFYWVDNKDVRGVEYLDDRDAN